MSKKQIWIITIVGGLVVAVIVAAISITLRSHTYVISIEPLSDNGTVQIRPTTLQEKAPNKDGIIFIRLTGNAPSDESLKIEVQPDDVPDWFEQRDVQRTNGTFIVRLQLGSVEWPIHGGEGYLVRASTDDESSLAKISVTRMTLKP